MLSDYLPPHTGGGVERVAIELCHGMARRGHTVHALTLRTLPAPLTEADGNLTISRVPAVDLTKRLGAQFAISAHIVPALVRTIHSFRPDIVHAHNLFFRTTEAITLYKIFSPIPVVTTLHLGQMEGERGVLKTLIQAYEMTIGKLIIHKSNHLVAVSEAVAQHAYRLGGTDKPLTVIPNGVDSSIFHPGKRQSAARKTILFVGRLVPNKGPDTLVKAAPRVLSNYPNVKFTFVGDGPLLKHLNGLAKSLGIEKSIEFLGIRNDVPELMREATILTRPSSVEGMPLTVLEAMASGLPVIATPVGGTPEILKDNINGYLIPVGDSTALATSIMKLLSNPSLADTMGRSAREMVESKYTWKQVVEQTESVYNRVVQE